MAWIMTTRRVLGGIEIAVGAIQVATIRFKKPAGAILWVPLALSDTDRAREFDTVSDALKHLHTVLSAAPPEGLDFEVGRKGAAKQPLGNDVAS